jgi:colicin import membrane protein
MAKIKQGRSEAAKARDKIKDAEIEKKMIVWQREKEERFAAEAARIEADRRAREAAKAEKERRKQEKKARGERRKERAEVRELVLKGEDVPSQKRSREGVPAKAPPAKRAAAAPKKKPAAPKVRLGVKTRKVATPSP